MNSENKKLENKSNKKQNNNKSLRDFYILWSTQSLSQLGSAITGFALTLWLYEKTGSALSTAALAICTYAPYVVMSILSATPLAIFPSVEAVHGAISMASAHSPRATCECHVPSRCEKKSLMTGFCVSADSVMGVINSLPAGVMTTCTSAPALMRPRIIRHAL